MECYLRFAGERRGHACKIAVPRFPVEVSFFSPTRQALMGDNTSYAEENPMAVVGFGKVVDLLRRGCSISEPDGDLLDRFVTHRDEAAFAELVARHGPKVYSVCCRILGQHQLAEDAFQATFIVLAKKAHSVHPRSAVGGFLYGVARKAALSAYSVTRRRKETLVGRVPETRLAEQSAADSDALAMLDEEIANLSKTLRGAVLLCELDGISRADAAKQLGIAEGTLSSRLAAARKQLAERLKQRGVALSTGLFAGLGSSAKAVCPPILEVATASVTSISEGVLRTMLLAKLKTSAMIGVLLAMLIGLGGFVRRGGHEATAAPPVPKVEKDEGLIWVFDPPAGVLIAFTPDGKELKTVKLRDGAMDNFYFVGITGDGQRAMILAKSGKIPDAPASQIEIDGLTVHLLPLHEPGKLTDTGIKLGFSLKNVAGVPGTCDTFTSSLDGQFIYRCRVVSKEGAERATWSVTRFDHTGKNEKEILLPEHMWLTCVYRNGDLLLNTYRPKESPIYVAYRFTPGGKPELVSGKSDVEIVSASPDGKSHLATALPNAVGPRNGGGQLVVIDPKSGKHTRIDKRKNTSNIQGFWSPDGKRIVVEWYERVEFTSKGGNQKIGRPGAGEITICNADGSGESRMMELSDPGYVIPSGSQLPPVTPPTLWPPWAPGDNSPASSHLPQRKHLLGWFPSEQAGETALQAQAIDWKAFDDPKAIILTDPLATSIRDLAAPERAVAVKRLLESLKSDEVEVRRRAALTLGSLGDKSGVPVMVEDLAKATGSDRNNVLVAIRILQDERAIPALRAALKDKTPYVRGIAVAALGELKAGKAFDDIVSLTRDKEGKDDGKVDVALNCLRICPADMACYALGALGDNRAVPVLIGLLEDKDLRVPARQALEILTKQKLGDDPKLWKVWWDSTGG
jgi:RNA polymerase sigma factor (sigma-70 family)